MATCLVFKPGACQPKASTRLISFVCEVKCACVSTPEAVNYIHMIINLYIKLSKCENNSMHGCGHCKFDRNQPNKAMLVP